MDLNGLGLGLLSSMNDWGLFSHQITQYHAAYLGAVVKLSQ